MNKEIEYLENIDFSENYLKKISKKLEELKNNENEKLLSSVFRYLGDKKTKNIIISGPPSIGKTYLFEKLFIYGKTHYPNAYYITEAKFETLYKQQALKIREDKMYDIRDYPYELMMKTNLLILDDIGTTNIRPGFLAYYLEVLNYRLKKNKKTIIITNHSAKDLASIMERRVMERLLENHVWFEIKSWTNKRFNKINKETF